MGQRILGAVCGVFSVFAATLAVHAQVMLTGRVVDEHDAPVVNARVQARRAQENPIETYSSPSGAFRMSLPGPGEYVVSVRRSGYFELSQRTLKVDGGGAEMTLVLNPEREVFQSVTVGEAPSPVDPAITDREQRLGGTEINDVPYPGSHSLRNAMKLMPGVVQDPSGGVHFHGGAEYQTQYTLDGFDITDPITGRFSTRLAVEGVRSLELTSTRESPQFGRGSAGHLAITPENGADQFHYTATNFVPGIKTSNGFHFGDWAPRAGFSGPIVKGRAWFSDSFDGEYNSGFINGLPKGQDRNTVWALGNLLHAQVNLTPANILYADFLSNFEHQSHFGLGALDPVSTTTGLSSREWLAAVKDTYSWRNGALIEVGFAQQRVFHDRVPEGTALYLLTPQGRSGNYFLQSRETAHRNQVFTKFFAPAFHAKGRHQVLVGEDLEMPDYSGQFRRTGYQVIGLSGLPLTQTVFRGSGDVRQSNKVVAWFVNDHWQPWTRLTIDAGLRQDWDALVGASALSPRISAAWAPFADARTKISAGYAIVRDATNLALFSRPLDQQAVTTTFSEDGLPGIPLVTAFAFGHGLKLPRSSQWSAGAERDLGGGLAANVQWLRKRGSDGFLYAAQAGEPALNLQPQELGYGFGGSYVLTNLRHDKYDEVAVTVRKSLAEQFFWMASYVRSRAVSNAVLDVSVDQPLQVLDNYGAVPWDAPNRLLASGYLPLLRKNWAVAFLAEWRSGFPFSVTTDAGAVVGPVDAHRFPSNFDLNLHIERRFTLAGYRLAVRAGANNLTAHRNPTAVNAVIGSPQFLQFFGDEGRHFVFRIRIFGKATK